MRNYVMTKLRSDLYVKILQLPIGYFTEQRKGDIISRMSNDANEVEWSVMSTLEGLIREPLTILIILFALVFPEPPVIPVPFYIAALDRVRNRKAQPFFKKAIRGVGRKDGHIECPSSMKHLPACG